MIDEYRKLASDWQTLVHKYGGKVLGFYYDKKKEEVIGIAEYENLKKLEELQKHGINIDIQLRIPLFPLLGVIISTGEVLLIFLGLALLIGGFLSLQSPRTRGNHLIIQYFANDIHKSR